MNTQDLREALTNRSLMTSLGKNKEFVSDIKSRFNWYISHHPKMPLRWGIQMLVDGVTEELCPKCPVCGKPVSYDKARADKFVIYCSPQCSRSTGKLQSINPEAKSKLLDKAWLYNQRIDLQKSYDEIAADLGCSAPTVKASCKKASIPEVKYNCSDIKVQLLLQDRDWLYNQYVILNKKASEIAEEIGSSASTISIFLNKHGIPITPNNNYPRK